MSANSDTEPRVHLNAERRCQPHGGPARRAAGRAPASGLGPGRVCGDGPSQGRGGCCFCAVLISARPCSWRDDMTVAGVTPSARRVATAKRAPEGYRVAEPGPCRPAGDPGLHFRGSPRWLGSRPLCHTASRASIRNPSISRASERSCAAGGGGGQLALRSARDHVRHAGRLPRSEAGAIQSTSGSQGARGRGSADRPRRALRRPAPSPARVSAWP